MSYAVSARGKEGHVPVSHSLMDGKLHMYRRENSRYWQCATYLSGCKPSAIGRNERRVRARVCARSYPAFTGPGSRPTGSSTFRRKAR